MVAQTIATLYFHARIHIGELPQACLAQICRSRLTRSVQRRCNYRWLILRPSPAVSPMRPLAALFFYPYGVIWPSRAPGSSFSPGFGPSSIRRAQAIIGPLGCARGLRTREKRGWARSVSERTREPHYLVANPPLPPLVALSPPAPPLANSLAGCLHSAIPPPTSLYSTVRRAVCLYSAIGQLLSSRLVDTPGRCSSICLGGHGLGRRGGADVR
jgi:hypothetical protein